jgi:hypothetical protein
MSATSDLYLSRAAESAKEAAESGLENVRERHLRAERVWRDMAEKLLHTERLSAERAHARRSEDQA